MIKIDLYQLNRKMKLRFIIENMNRIASKAKKQNVPSRSLRNKIKMLSIITAKTSSSSIPTSNDAQSWWGPPWHTPEGVVSAGYAAVPTAPTCSPSRPSRPSRPRPATLSASNDEVCNRTRH